MITGYFILDVQQLLLFSAFACQFFSFFFFFGNFTNATDVCPSSNWNKTTNNHIFIHANQFIS